MASPASFVAKFIGIACLLAAGTIFVRIFFEPVKLEVEYTANATMGIQPKQVFPPNREFALVIDKISAAAPIIANVDPTDSVAYQLALSEGVAHARGTGFPGQGKNIFLFAHSSADFATATRFNSVFYLIHHLVSGDTIRVWYQGREFDYAVSDNKIVEPTDTSYLQSSPGGDEQLTLMTCWPPGTSLKRLIVTALPTAIQPQPLR